MGGFSVSPRSIRADKREAHVCHNGGLRQRGMSRATRNVQQREVTMTGRIRTLRVDKGFGFIQDDAQKEYFFHQSAVYGEGLQDLREGDTVEFDVGQGPKGPRAENVRRTST
jgi:CspA family cold shock protein